MKLTAQEEFGLRCMVQMAVQPEPASATTVASIAARESLSPAYVAKLMRLLREGGLVRSTRGQKGGYALTRTPDHICVREVLAALGGRLFTTEFCTRHAGDDKRCVHNENCGLRALWANLDGLVFNLLERCTLSHLAQGERAMDTWIADQLQHLPQPENN